MTIIRDYKAKDLQAIVDILNYYVKNDVCIFQMEPYTLFEIEKKYQSFLPAYPFYVAELNGKVIGFTYGARWRDKPAYAKSVETTIYIHPEHKKSGVGKPLYEKLIASLTDMDFHLLVAGMTMPNKGSQTLHESLGFEKVGEFKDAGMKFGQWHSVGFWQKVLN
jgi:phosphinothricin acetyltransferase